MKRNQIQNLRIHTVPAPDKSSAAGRANQFYLQLIGRRLAESALTPLQKVQVLTQIQQQIKHESK